MARHFSLLAQRKVPKRNGTLHILTGLDSSNGQDYGIFLVLLQVRTSLQLCFNGRLKRASMRAKPTIETKLE